MFVKFLQDYVHQEQLNWFTFWPSYWKIKRGLLFLKHVVHITSHERLKGFMSSSLQLQSTLFCTYFYTFIVQNAITLW